MAWGDLPKCRQCRGILIFMQTEAGRWMPCDSFSVTVLPDDKGALYYTDHRKSIRGRKCDPETEGAVRAWEPHFVTCKGAAPKAKAKPATVCDVDSLVKRLIAEREREWGIEKAT